MNLLSIAAALLVLIGSADAIRSNILDNEGRNAEFKNAWQHVFALNGTHGIETLIEGANNSANLDAIFDEIVGLVAYSQPSVGGDKDKYGIGLYDLTPPRSEKLNEEEQKKVKTIKVINATLKKMARLASIYGLYQK